MKKQCKAKESASCTAGSTGSTVDGTDRRNGSSAAFALCEPKAVALKSRQPAAQSKAYQPKLVGKLESIHVIA